MRLYIYPERAKSFKSLPFKTADAASANNGKWLPLREHLLPPL